MAYALPDSAFSGIDLSAAAIERAAALSDALGLENVDLRRADLTALPDAGDVRLRRRPRRVLVDRAARRATRCSRPAARTSRRDGVAYVSYDVFPAGTCARSPARCCAGTCVTSTTRQERIAQARALLTAVMRAGAEGDELRQRLAWQAEWALAQGDAALYHDELAEHHEAVLFADFVAHAARHGLRFLAEADVFEMQAGPLPAESPPAT